MISEQELLREIEEYENKTPTYQVCEKLATLYTIYDHNFSKSLSKFSYSSSRELQQENIVGKNIDILPAYHSYVEVKKRFQYGDVPKEKVLYFLNTLSQEIKDFFAMLYRNTDMPEERDIINQLINDINVGNI